MGRVPPNFTPIPNTLLEKIVKSRHPGMGFRILLVIARKTYGWGKEQDKISYSQLERATGISHRSLVRTVKKLVSSGALVARIKKGKTNIYSFGEITSDIKSTGTSAVKRQELVSPMPRTIERQQKKEIFLSNSQVIENGVVTSDYPVDPLSELTQEQVEQVFNFAEVASTKRRGL